MKKKLVPNLDKKDRDFHMSLGIVLLWASLYVIGLFYVQESHFVWAYPLMVLGLIFSVEATSGHGVLKGLSEHAAKSLHKRKR